MAILTTSRGQRHYHSVSRLPKRETRIAEKPDAPFADGLVIDTPGMCTPIDQRVRPTVEGWGLTPDECSRITGAQNRARAAFGADCPDAPMGEVDRVAWAARKDEFRRVLADRPAAPALKVVEPAKANHPAGHRFDAAKLPVSRPVKTPVRKLAATIRPTHTPSDEAWWAANAPSCRLGFYVEGTTDPSDPFNWSMPAMEYRFAAMMAASDLSDDYNDALATGCREGGDR